jgi:regulator of cell morphogenesis and NO signaling
MLTLTTQTRVSELQNGPPRLLNAFLSTGLFREGDDPEVTLGELCWNFALNPGMLLATLKSANITEELPPLDIAPFQNMPLVSLVEHIEQVHHVYLRKNLPRLTALTAAVAADATNDENLADLNDEMQSIAAELETHLRHEEEALFSLVRDLGTNRAITPTRCGGSVGGPIACMENDHELAVQTLRKMRELTGNYTAPAEASSAWCEMLQGLADFDRDMQEHMYLENQVLFPRALEAQRGRRVAAAG